MRSSSGCSTFKYWYTEPTPPGRRRQQVLLVGEPPDHLPRRRIPRGPRVPRRDVRNDGRTGAEHADDRRSAHPRPGSTRRCASGSPSGTPTSTTKRTSRRCSRSSSSRPTTDLADRAGDGARPRVLLDIALHLQQRQLRRDARPLVHEGQEHRGRPGHVRARRRCCSTTRPSRHQPAPTPARRLLARARKYRVPDVDPARSRRSDEPTGRPGAHERAPRPARAGHRGSDRARTAIAFDDPENVAVLVGARRANSVASASRRRSRRSTSTTSGTASSSVRSSRCATWSATTWTRRAELAPRARARSELRTAHRGATRTRTARPT